MDLLGSRGRQGLWVGVAVSGFLILLFFFFWFHKQKTVASGLLTTPGFQVPLYDPHDKPMTILAKMIDTQDGLFFNSPIVIHQSKSRYNQMKQALLAYLQGPRIGKVRVPVPDGMALNEFYLTPAGTAVADLDLSQVDLKHFGFYEETLFIRGLIEVLTGNFFEIKQVKVLVNGLDSPTLGGNYALDTADVGATLSAPDEAIY